MIMSRLFLTRCYITRFPYDNEQVVPYEVLLLDASLKERRSAHSARVAHKGRCHSLIN